MQRSSATLFVDTRGWRLVLGTKDQQAAEEGPWSESEASSAAERVAEVIAERSPKTRRVAVLLDASLCMTANFQIESARQARKREALLYKIEEHVPVAAEDLVADFVRHGSQIYAMAVERRLIEPLINALQNQALDIELISPVVSLAWQQHFAGGNRPEREAVVWLDPNQDGNLVVFSSGQPVSWARLTSVNGLLGKNLFYAHICSSDELPLVVYAPQAVCENGLLPAISCSPLELRAEEGDPLCSHAFDTLAAIRSGHKAPAFDLRRGLKESGGGSSPLATEIRLLQLAVLLLLVSALTANVVASRRASRAVDDIVASQDDVWREVFPGSKLPRGVRPRLQSELAKLAGARGNADDTVADTSVLPLISSCLQAMPLEMRFRLLDVKIEGHDLDLTGEVRDFGDADKIAASIRSQGFQVNPPTTRRLPEQGVGLRLQAKYVGPTVQGVTADE